MKIVRSFAGGGGRPPVLDLEYNGDLAADSTTKRYAGSLVKRMDYDDIDNGQFYTFAGLATAMENVMGILLEEQPTSGNYLPNDASYGMVRRRVQPILPGDVIRAEYVQADRAGTVNYDTGATGSAAGTSLTISITTADTLIGGWVYFVSGLNDGYLHYITDNSTSAITLATALAYAVASGDDFLVIEPPHARIVDFNATYTDIKSEVDDNVKTDAIVGLNTLISAPGTGLTYLDRNKHDGLKIANAKFYHDFILPNTMMSHPIATS